MSGDTLVRELRARSELGAVPVLLLTAKADDELRIRLLREGAQDYVTKPFSVEELRARVENLVEVKLAGERNRRLNRELAEHNERLRELTSQLQAANTALEAAQDALVRKERLAVLGQLAGGVSHELRNPLGVIKNAVYYLRTVLPESEPVAKHLRIIEREILTANRIVTGLLDFARMASPSRTPTDLNELITDCLERTMLPERVTPVCNLSPRVPPVAIDREQVGLVLRNLIMNAIQAMPEGGTLTLATTPADSGVIVTVADTGVGIPPEDQKQIFEPLFTTKAKGIGLGLAVAERLAEANNGTIRVESAPGRGSRFIVPFRGETSPPSSA